MRIKDRPEYSTKAKPLTFTKNTTVSTAVKAMAGSGYGSAVITAGKKIQGIVTERDLMVRLLAEGKDPKKTKLADIMTSDVRTANENDNVVDWLRIMSNERFRHLPIVDDQNNLISIMSQGDFVSYTWPDLLDRVKGKAKETLGRGYEIILIVLALLGYALLVDIIS